MNRFVAACVALGMAACSFAPEYKRPETGVPAQYRFVNQSEAASIADMPWWHVFKDPVLQDLIRVAIANNQDLALAAARVDEARANVGIARADLYPQLAAQVGGAYGRPVSKKIDPAAITSGRYSAQLDLSWEIDLWGRVRNSRDAAMADLLATEDGRRAVLLSLVSSMAQSYLDLRELDLELEIAKSNTAARKVTLDLFEARARRGVASDLEVNQARSDLAVTTAAIPETELQIALREHQLCVLLGRPPGPIPRGAALVETQVPPEVPAGVPAQLLERRPDVLAAEQNVIGAGKRVGVAVADRLPALSLSGFIGLMATTIPDLGSADAVAGSAGGSLLAPIFQGGRLSSAEEASRARLEQAVASYKKAVQQALQEVADAAAGIRKLHDARLAHDDQVKAITVAARLALKRYEGGVSSYFEVLDAQRQQFDAELGLARSQRDELTSVVLLYRALGGGWQTEETPPPPPAANGGHP
ncbi:MAG TPA: efflux transporter outer membrane subunit [Myxococcales bacterium]|jgi:multidrug efflux system outer membrane protein|nr:efflux transporter outer membrane subunit [Myxococcales bacterium]